MKGQRWYQSDDVAASYDEKRFSRGGEIIDRREKDARSMPWPIQDRRVLEIACGTGRFTVMLADQGADVIGLDISSAMLKLGRKKAQQAGLASELEFIDGDAARLPYPDNAFDTVVAMRFFHLADDPDAFLSEMRRVASEQIIFDTFNRYSSRSLYNWALPMGSRLYSRREVRTLLERHDLTLTAVADDFLLPYGLYRAIPSAIARPLRWTDEALGSLPGVSRLASVSYWDVRLP
ncbi:MAG: class I SAM-dependent methyltransferase [Natrialbaceae archaeon]|nr:class I SAM-dependent methyltransferase [Natrialbaceae archaeon]